MSLCDLLDQASLRIQTIVGAVLGAGYLLTTYCFGNDTIQKAPSTASPLWLSHPKATRVKAPYANEPL